jgi:8-oxo-dGTP diphosphatase
VPRPSLARAGDAGSSRGPRFDGGTRGRAYTRAVGPPAVIAVLRKDDRVLAILRGPDVISPGWWTLPGGRIERGESEEEALVRELWEELGLHVTPLVKVWECDTDDGDFHLHWWTADFEGELHPEASEIAETRWVTPTEFLELEPTFGGDREFVEHVLPTLD